MHLEDDFRDQLYRAAAQAKQEGEHGKGEDDLPLERRLELSLAKQRALERMVLELASEIDRLKRPS
jgi:hypothetical protein